MLSHSKLGFGLMRLPKDENGVIDQTQVQTMVYLFMHNGFTYFDTAYAYAGSENAIREALVKRYPRDTFTLADKLPAWKLKGPEDVERVFQESMEAAGVDYFDFYLLHSVEEKHLPTYEKYNTFDFLKEMKAKGKIRHIGFSYHDGPELLEQILTRHPELEFVQLQLNYLDWENEVIQAKRNYEAARRFGKPVVVMEPIKGGTLAVLPPEAEAIRKQTIPHTTPSSLALRFLAEKEGVMTILSGMSNGEQMKENTATMRNASPLTETESKAVAAITRSILSADTIPCTKCRYCVAGCPMHIAIPDLFTAYNSQRLYGEHARYQTYYNKFSSLGNPASACVACGQCEGVCPQHLSIVSLLKTVSEAFDH